MSSSIKRPFGSGEAPSAGASVPPPATEAGPPPGALSGASVPGFVSAAMRELTSYVSEVTAQTILSACATTAGVRRDQLEARHLPVLVAQVQASFRFFGVPPERRDRCLEQLRALGAAQRSRAFDNEMITMVVENEQDIVSARLAGKAFCQRLGFTEIGTTKVMTAISELSRNIHKYAGRGVIHMRQMPGDKPYVQIIATDRGPGIPDVDKVLSPSFRSASGMGRGLRGTRDLMDYFDIYSRPGEGTVVTVRKTVC